VAAISSCEASTSCEASATSFDAETRRRGEIRKEKRRKDRKDRKDRKNCRIQASLLFSSLLFLSFSASLRLRVKSVPVKSVRVKMVDPSKQRSLTLLYSSK
jgi:hypothetical protein